MSVFERNAKIWTAAIALIAVSVVDIGAGIMYRVVQGYPWAERAQRIFESREREFRESSAAFHHGLGKSKTVKDALWGHRSYEMITDSLGFRSRSMKTVNLTSARHRVLFMGDSFTEGIGVDYPDTFVGIIESNLAREDVEVLNAAVTSYSPIICWRKIKHLVEDVGLRFDEVVVYIDISDAQDEALSYELSDDGRVVLRAPKPEPVSLAAYFKSTAKKEPAGCCETAGSTTAAPGSRHHWRQYRPRVPIAALRQAHVAGEDGR